MAFSRHDKYILIDHEPVALDDLEVWARWYEDSGARGGRQVGDTEVAGRRVSTVFLGLNLQFGDGPPLLFETMVFADPQSSHELYCERYTTWRQAEAGHQRVVEALRSGTLALDGEGGSDGA